MAFNYPLSSSREQDFARLFFNTALIEDSNLYYYPKPNHYTEIDDFAFFALRRNLTPENLKIESLYRHKSIDRGLRNKLHSLLRNDYQIPQCYVSKKFFYESRMLFNLSYEWKAFDAPKENVRHDLLDNVEHFYPAPLEVNIATTNVCNLKCIMCSLHAPEIQKTHHTDFFKKPAFLDDTKVYEIIDYCATKGVHNVSFTAAGEVLLDERIFDFIAYAKSKGIALISLVSNGILLERYGTKLLDCGLNRLTVSIDGATPEIYKKIRGADLDKVEEGVKKCVFHARKALLDFEIELACVLVFEEMASSEQKALYLSKWQDYRDIIKRITFNNLATFDENGWDTRNAAVINHNHRNTCHFPYQRFMIDPYGAVTVCCTMSSSAYWQAFSVGNVHEHSLESIWTSQAMRTLRKENLDKKFCSYSICARCNEWAYNDFSQTQQDDKPAAQEKDIYYA